MLIFCNKCRRKAETSKALLKRRAKICLECAARIKREYEARCRLDPKYGKEQYRKRKKKISEERAQRRRADPEFREREIAGNHKQRLKRIGLTTEQYEAMVVAQKSLCAICGQPETRQRLGRISKLAVDHDHKTGRVRGLLCHRHNLGIGGLKDSSTVVRAAISYLLASNPGLP